MVEVAYLAISEQPPAGERFILDRALSPWGQNYRRALPQGHPGECACAFPASEISAFSRMVDRRPSGRPPSPGSLALGSLS